MPYTMLSAKSKVKSKSHKALAFIQPTNLRGSQAWDIQHSLLAMEWATRLLLAEVNFIHDTQMKFHLLCDISVPVC